jgi:hypothetical protein
VFHSREKRRELEKELPRLAREGSLVDMSRLFDNAADRDADQQGFEDARVAWREAQQQINAIEMGQEDTHDDAIRTAQQVAGLISVTLSFIAVTLLILDKLVNG